MGQEVLGQEVGNPLQCVSDRKHGNDYIATTQLLDNSPVLEVKKIHLYRGSEWLFEIAETSIG